MLGRKPNPEIEAECYVDFIEWIQMALTKAFEFAREIMGKSISRQKRNYGSKVQNAIIEEGSWVWYHYLPQAKMKLGNYWQGPFLILTKFSDVTFKIQRSEHGRPRVVHIDDLKQYEGEETPVSWLNETESVLSGPPVDQATQTLDETSYWYGRNQIACRAPERFSPERSH